jgi:hypothetical protein
MDIHLLVILVFLGGCIAHQVHEVATVGTLSKFVDELLAIRVERRQGRFMHFVKNSSLAAHTVFTFH